MKVAVVLFNLGGPDKPASVRPFLTNLFSDPAIVRLPSFLRLPLARFIAGRRARVAAAIYEKIGGRSPILAETQRQAAALEAHLGGRGYNVRCFIAMRYWHPLTDEAVRGIRIWKPDRIVLLPLYPQFSTTTTQSSLDAWQEASREALEAPTTLVCCFPWSKGFVAALSDLLLEALSRRKAGIAYRILFSAHGLPKRIDASGDPYAWQVERTVAAVLERLAGTAIESRICYQSRVGPLTWLQPSTDAEIRRAGEDSKGLIVVPVAFVSEHSETLVELDIDYARLAREAGVVDFIRVATVRTHPEFIAALGELVVRALSSERPVTCAPHRICPWGKICAQAETP